MSGPARPITGERDATAIGRVVIGAALVVSGVAAFLATQGAFAAFGQGLVAVVVVIGGLALIFGPWLWRLSHALVEERAERIRSDERAEMAAHLHDSVLQTLAMIQRRADEPRAVVGLARRQERELRAWLFGRAPVHADLDLGDAIEGAAADVEQRDGVPIEVVRVGGECALDDHMQALVLAAREAMVNAARHSGAPRDRGLPRGRTRPGDGVRPRPRPRLRSGVGAERPRRHRRVDHRAHASPRRHRRRAVTVR